MCLLSGPPGARVTIDRAKGLDVHLLVATLREALARVEAQASQAAA